MNDKPKVYSPDNESDGAFTGFIEIFTSLPQIHGLAYRLFLRNLKGQYRQSFLGLFWTILPPLVTSLIWIFLNNQSVISIDVSGVSYPIFVIVGTTLWQTFGEGVNAPMKGVNSGRSMLAKINFPRESLLLAGLYESVFNLIIKIALVILVFLFLGQPFTTTLPLGILAFFPMLLLGFSIGTILVPFGMLISDVQRGLSIILQFAIYLTPVIYPSPSAGQAKDLMMFNPVAPLLNTGRNLMVGLPVENWSLFTTVVIGSIVLLFFGLIIYRLSMNIIIERFGG